MTHRINPVELAAAIAIARAMHVKDFASVWAIDSYMKGMFARRYRRLALIAVFGSEEEKQVAHIQQLLHSKE